VAGERLDIGDVAAGLEHAGEEGGAELVRVRALDARASGVGSREAAVAVAAGVATRTGLPASSFGWGHVARLAGVNDSNVQSLKVGISQKPSVA
jgi:hypothetical protein